MSYNVFRRLHIVIRVFRTNGTFEWGNELWKHPTCSDTAFPCSISPPAVYSIYYPIHGSKQKLSPEGSETANSMQRQPNQPTKKPKIWGRRLVWKSNSTSLGLYSQSCIGSITGL